MKKNEKKMSDFLLLLGPGRSLGTIYDTNTEHQSLVGLIQTNDLLLCECHPCTFRAYPLWRRTCVRVHIGTHTYTHIHAHAHNYMQAQANANARTHTYTHTWCTQGEGNGTGEGEGGGGGILKPWSWGHARAMPRKCFAYSACHNHSPPRANLTEK